MKKLLSLLTISTLTASIPAPLLANTVQTRVKRDVITSNSNNDYLPIKEFKNISGYIKSIAFDSQDNVYFGAVSGLYLLKKGSSVPTKINDLIGKNVSSIAFDSKYNIYIGTNSGAFVLKHRETTPTKIAKINSYVYSVAIDSQDNVYFGWYHGIHKLVAGSDTPTKIDGISDNAGSIVIDNKDNIYFGTNSGAFVLKHGETTPTKIDGINDDVGVIIIDKQYNIYFGTNSGAFVLKHGETTPTKIDGINDDVGVIIIDKQYNIYFGTNSGAFVLKHGETTPTKIDGINDDVSSIAFDSKYNIYIAGNDWVKVTTTVLDWLKQQSHFNLVDSTKKQTWTRPDLLSVDGELNIEIANHNIDKVVFDNVQQGQTNKQWKINVKPETAPRDHNLQVMFTLNGKQYTSEIIVSMQAKIDSTPTPVQQNLSDLIKTTDLGNIIDNNDDTIFPAVNQKNSNVIDDFSQVEITDKTDIQATLTAKKDSKSYKGSVDVTYNIIPATVVDLKIDVTPPSTATVIKDYLGQIDTSNLTNPVNTFYCANSESIITMVKPTASSRITGVVYGCDDKWNKTSQSSNIDLTSGIKLDGSQLATNNGKYVVELSDNLGHTNNVYLQINKDKAIANYFDTDNGKQFEMWAKANRHDNIRGYSASQLNKLFAESKNWQQIASDNQFAKAVSDWFKVNGKLSSKELLTKEQVVEQLKTQIPSSITISGVNTSNYDVKKVSFELNQSEFKPNDKVNITVKYNNANSEQFTLQIKNTNTHDNNKKTGLGIWAIFGIVVGSLAGLVLLGWLFKKFVVDPFILKPIRDKKEKAFVAKTEKDIAQMKKDDEEWEAKQRGEK